MAAFECLEWERSERAYYAAHEIQEELQSRDRLEDNRAHVYGRTASTGGVEDRTFSFVRASISRVAQAEALLAMKSKGRLLLRW